MKALLSEDIVGDLPNVQHFEQEDYEAGLADVEQRPSRWQRLAEMLSSILRSLLSAPLPR